MNELLESLVGNLLETSAFIRRLGELKQIVDEFMALLDDKKYDDHELEGPIEKTQGKLDTWLKKA